MSQIADGVYTISLPHGDSRITDPGEGRWLNLLPGGSLGKDADKIRIKFNGDRGGYSLQFEKSGKYFTFEGSPFPNNKLLDGDKPRYFKIQKHEFYPDMYAINLSEDKNFHIAMAMERIYPPWVAMNSFPEMQPWKFEKA
ncbi:hypothetical protein RSOLAG1IB_12581 [Rhizoctonia solani AG-1 IB]|uniref:Uncharacterized protein n=1 Tax=Thanatephorus cucumeris (strain AG1-IB / isolate 7/3/14) TaxID=1108050 RepID=A0A0B7FXZ0_THACB|nr:hypothetical protein RSOLAG1IB_12581 [Rhizoctonia solani AG-1 IB]